MTIDQLPGEIEVPTKDEEIAAWKQHFKLRQPGADVSDGTQPDADARVCSDETNNIYSKVVIAGQSAVLEAARGEAVDAWAIREGVEPRQGPVGSSGFVAVTTNAGGATALVDDELIHEPTGMVFRTTQTKKYTNGQACPIVAKSVGSATNLPPGTVLKWSSPQSGFGPNAVVTEQTDGSGLTGGREAEVDEDVLVRIQDAKANPAASGNDAQYQQAVSKLKTIAVQRAFTYPAILGANTICVVFTLRPDRAGGSRVPTSLQVSLAESEVVGQMPGDDGAIFAMLAQQSAEVVYRISWAEEAIGWADIAPWPSYYAAQAIHVQSASSPLSFILKSANNSYTGLAAPVPGKNICFYDPDGYAFRKKRVLTVTGTGPWTITCDASNDSSDTSFTPVAGQRAMPWSESLDDLLPGIWAYSDRLGPGEMRSTFYDPGTRQRRSPRPKSTSWPSALTTRGLVEAVASDLLADADPVEGDGVTAAVGTPGVLAYLLRINAISFFPEAT